MSAVSTKGFSLNNLCVCVCVCLPGCRSVKLCMARHCRFVQTFSCRVTGQIKRSVNNQHSSKPASELNNTKQQHVDLHSSTHEFRLIKLLSPLVSFEQRVLTQTAVCGRRLVEARPAAALLGVLLLVVELLYEAEDVLQLALALGELQTGAQQTDGGVTLLLFLRAAQRLRRVRQNRRRAHILRGRLEKTHNQRKHDFSSAFCLMCYANEH